MDTSSNENINSSLYYASGRVGDKRRKKAVTTLILIMLSYVVCNTPYMIHTYFFVASICLKSGIIFNSTVMVSLLCVQFLSVGLNSTIYICRTRNYRRFFSRRRNSRKKSKRIVVESKMIKWNYLLSISLLKKSYIDCLTSDLISDESKIISLE